MSFWLRFLDMPTHFVVIANDGESFEQGLPL